MNIHLSLTCGAFFVLQLCDDKEAEWIPLCLPSWESWNISIIPDADEVKDEDIPHPDLASVSIRFAGPMGKTYGWKSVVARRRDAATQRAELLEAIFGIQAHAHELVGQGFRREWMDVDGRHMSVEGIISKCTLDGDNEFFDVALDESNVSIHKDHCHIPDCLPTINYMDAWGGYKLFRECYSLPCPEVAREAYLTWLVPTNVQNTMSADGLPSRQLSCLGWKLTLYVAQSEIDHQEAHRGCFVMCESESIATAGRDRMVLEPGMFIDLGLYAHPVDDCISDQEFACKNFIHSQMADKYTFEQLYGMDVLDVGDHLSATLKKTAQANVLPYVNETDGVEQPCVVSKYDPAGGVSTLYMA